MAEEPALAKEAGSVGAMEEKADTAPEEKEFAEWAGSAGEANGVGTGAPLVEEAVEESAKGYANIKARNTLIYYIEYMSFL